MNNKYVFVNKTLENKLMEYRRDFHRYPELGWTEYRTSWKIAEILQKFGYEVWIGEDVCAVDSRMGVPSEDELIQSEIRAAKEGVPKAFLKKMSHGCTGVIGVIRGMFGSKKTAVRFDIDALPIKENDDNNTFISVHESVMHACGHDGHMAVGLGLAEILSQNREYIDGEIRLIFQPAEEGCRGAKAIVDKGWILDVDEFYSGHIGIGCRELGQIAACTRGFMASSKLDIYFHGVAAHAANAPEKGRNALLAAADFTVKAYDFYRNAPEDARMNVGKFIGGSGRNIIADEAYLEVETRGTTSEMNRKMRDSICRLMDDAAKRHNVTCHVDLAGDVDTGKSDQELIFCGYEAAVSVGIGDKYLSDAEFTASEDVVNMMNHVQDHGGKAVYFMFGTKLKAEHHHPSFDFDERVLPLMVEFYSKVLVKKHK